MLHNNAEIYVFLQVNGTVSQFTTSTNIIPSIIKASSAFSVPVSILVGEFVCLRMTQQVSLLVDISASKIPLLNSCGLGLYTLCLTSWGTLHITFAIHRHSA